MYSPVAQDGMETDNEVFLFHGECTSLEARPEIV
jgi:hypothetical protein